MLGDTVKKLEDKIKDLNALKADYRKELEEHHKDLIKKKITQQKYDKIKEKYDAKMDSISVKIHEKREKLEAMKKKK